MSGQAYNEIFRKLEHELTTLEINSHCFIEATEKALGLWNKVILHLRARVLNHGFSDDAEEIYLST